MICLYGLDVCLPSRKLLLHSWTSWSSGVWKPVRRWVSKHESLSFTDNNNNKNKLFFMCSGAVQMVSPVWKQEVTQTSDTPATTRFSGLWCHFSDSWCMTSGKAWCSWSVTHRWPHAGSSQYSGCLICFSHLSVPPQTLRAAGKSYLIVFLFVFFPGCFFLLSLILAVVVVTRAEQEETQDAEAIQREEEFGRIVEVLKRREEEEVSKDSLLPQELGGQWAAKY